KDQPPVSAVDVWIDHERDDECGYADGYVDELPLEVVVGIAVDVEARHPGDRPEPDRNKARGAGQEEPVDGAQHGAEREPFVAVPLEPPSLRSGVLEHQRMVPINRSGSRSSARS